MMAQERGGIVKDGLVFWLDGFDRGGDGSKWYDKISKKYFRLRDIINHPGCVEFLGRRESYGDTYEIRGFPTKGTIQAVFNEKSEKQSWVFYVGGELMPGDFGSERFCIGRDANKFICTTNPRATMDASSIRPGQWATISYSLDGPWMVNGTEAPERSADQWAYSGAHNSVLSGRIYDAWARGYLACVRIYDRVLTKQEILQNQQYDIDTYFGGAL